MKINSQKNGSNMTIELTGRLDTSTAPELEKVINTSLENITKLVFDMDGLEYISSAGLRVLLSAQKTMNRQGQMKLINVNEAILEIFEITGFTDIMIIE